MLSKLRQFSGSLYTKALFMQLELELARVQQVYAVHEEQSRAVGALAAVLWANLDVDSIIAGVEATSAKLQRLGPALGDLPIYDAVAKDVGSFLASLPLMKDLKSEALRKRHWTTLMEVCGWLTGCLSVFISPRFQPCRAPHTPCHGIARLALHRVKCLPARCR
jgi:Dynein heavy chain, N-terminal region 2